MIGLLENIYIIKEAFWYWQCACYYLNCLDGLFQFSTSFLPVLYQFSTSLLPVCYQFSTSFLPIMFPWIFPELETFLLNTYNPNRLISISTVDTFNLRINLFISVIPAELEMFVNFGILLRSINIWVQLCTGCPGKHEN